MAFGLAGDDPNVRRNVLRDLVAKRLALMGQQRNPAAAAPASPGNTSIANYMQQLRRTP